MDVKAPLPHSRSIASCPRCGHRLRLVEAREQERSEYDPERGLPDPSKITLMHDLSMICFGGKKAVLTRTEFIIADVLAKHMSADAAVSIGSLTDAVYAARPGSANSGADAASRCMIAKVRRKVLEIGLRIVPVRGIGYRMEAIRKAKA